MHGVTWVHCDELFEHTEGCLTHDPAAANHHSIPEAVENLVQGPELQQCPK